MSIFDQGYPILMASGNLPYTQLSLVVERVYNRSGGALALGNVVQFDMHGSQAESTDGGTYPKIIWATGVGSSVFSNVCFAPAVSATTRSLSCAVFGVVTKLHEAGADNTTVDVTVIGEVNVVKSASLTHARGATYIPVTGAATLAITTATGSETGSKIVALALDNRSSFAGSPPTNAGTDLSCMFNGFGFGWN